MVTIGDEQLAFDRLFQLLLFVVTMNKESKSSLWVLFVHFSCNKWDLRYEHYVTKQLTNLDFSDASKTLLLLKPSLLDFH